MSELSRLTPAGIRRLVALHAQGRRLALRPTLIATAIATAASTGGGGGPGADPGRIEQAWGAFEQPRHATVTA